MGKGEWIVEWLQQQVKQAKAKGLVFGMSGGLDSSVVAALCKKAFPQNCLALVMPCEGNGKDLERAKMVAKKFGVPLKEIGLEGAFRLLSEKLGNAAGESRIAKANLKPRLRMLSLYYFANKMNYLVVGTGNKTELMVGYFTKYGDGAVDLLPLACLFKGEVKELGKELGLPKEVLEAVPSAGLWEGQTDEGEMGISYEKLDEVLAKIETGETGGIEKGLLEKVKKMVAGSQHKRDSIPACKLP